MNDIKKVIDIGLENIQLSDNIKMSVLNKTSVKKRKKRFNFKPLVISLASICTVSVLTISVGAISNGGVIEFINNMQVALQPINKSVTYDGITMSLISTAKEGDTIVAYFSLKDTTEKHRVTGNVDVYDWNFLSTSDASGGCSMYDYDEENEIATFKVTMSNWDNIPWTNKNTLKITKMLIGLKETTEIVQNIDLYTSANENLYADTEQVYYNGKGGLNGCYGYYSEIEEDSKYIILKKNRLSIPLDNHDWLEVSNIGFLDNHLHIQFQSIGKMSAYNHFSVDIIDKNGNNLTDNETSGSNICWNSYNDYGDIYERAYEYCYPTITDISQLEGAKLQGTFCEYDTILQGDWSITFSIDD